MEPGAATAEDTTRMGEYVVLKRVAIGGMAEIFLARKDGMSGFERLVVLKRILPEYAHSAEFVRMFLNEARIAATLHHTNIVQVHAIGEERGQVFFAMEFLHGEDLSRVLSRANQIGRPPQLDAVLTIASAVCSGLHYAHERTGPDGEPLGIVHRDVSPHNVFATYDGNIKLLDFGIAKATTSFGRTRTGVLKGKVAYMSPEQAYSQPVDRRSDIFCMGILLWELSTGRRLYRRRSELETLKALVDADAPKPSTVVSGYPVELEAIVMKCLSRDPSGRYDTCEQLSEALEAFAKNQSLQVSPLIATRMMRSLFKAEIASFEAAVKSGANLVDQVVARMEATAKKTSIDDWDSNVASIIVDIGSDPDKTSLTPPRERSAPKTITVDLDTETTAVEPTPVRVETEEPTLNTPPPMAAPPLAAPPMAAPPIDAASEATIPRPPVVVPMPVARPVIERPDQTEPRRRDDWTQRLASSPIGGAAIDEPAPKQRSRLPIIAGLAVAGIAIVIILVKSTGSSETKPADPPKSELAVKPPPIVDEPVAKPEPPPEAKPVPPVETKPLPIAKPKVAVKVEPKPVPKIAPKPVRPEIRTTPKPVAKIEPKIAPKKPEPKKPEPKKPTAKDLDALPL